MKILLPFAFAVLLSVPLIYAQSSPGQAAQNAADPAAGGQASTGNPPNSAVANSNQELTHTSNEAAGRTAQNVSGEHSSQAEHEDAEAAFKYSPAVRGIARITRLSVTTAYWICVCINFAVVAILIVLFMRSNLPALLRGRTQAIQKGMEDARRSSEEAQRRLNEIEARLSKLSVEIGEMEKHAETESRAEEERIRASIEVEKQKILETAQQEVGQASNAARRELQKYAVSLAIEMAEKGLRIDTNEDKALIEDFGDQLGAEARRNGNG